MTNKQNEQVDTRTWMSRAGIVIAIILPIAGLFIGGYFLFSKDDNERNMGLAAIGAAFLSMFLWGTMWW